MSDQMAALKLHRMRRWIDSEIERIDKICGSTGELGIDEIRTAWLKGRIHSLETTKVLHLLTPEEQAESARVRKEMFG